MDNKKKITNNRKKKAKTLILKFKTFNNTIDKYSK